MGADTGGVRKIESPPRRERPQARELPVDPPRTVLQMQRSAGNRATALLIQDRAAAVGFVGIASAQRSVPAVQRTAIQVTLTGATKAMIDLEVDDETSEIAGQALIDAVFSALRKRSSALRATDKQQMVVRYGTKTVQAGTTYTIRSHDSLTVTFISYAIDAGNLAARGIDTDLTSRAERADECVLACYLHNKRSESDYEEQQSLGRVRSRLDASQTYKLILIDSAFKSGPAGQIVEYLQRTDDVIVRVAMEDDIVTYEVRRRANSPPVTILYVARNASDQTVAALKADGVRVRMYNEEY